MTNNNSEANNRRGVLSLFPCLDLIKACKKRYNIWFVWMIFVIPEMIYRYTLYVTAWLVEIASILDQDICNSHKPLYHSIYLAISRAGYIWGRVFSQRMGLELSVWWRSNLHQVHGYPFGFCEHDYISIDSLRTKQIKCQSLMLLTGKKANFREKDNKAETGLSECYHHCSGWNDLNHIRRGVIRCM